MPDGHGCACLYSQHSRSWGRRINLEFKASLDYMLSPNLKKKKKFLLGVETSSAVEHFFRSWIPSQHSKTNNTWFELGILFMLCTIIKPMSIQITQSLKAKQNE
jgi:hypothetical protein